MSCVTLTVKDVVACINHDLRDIGLYVPAPKYFQNTGRYDVAVAKVAVYEGDIDLAFPPAEGMWFNHNGWFGIKYGETDSEIILASKVVLTGGDDSYMIVFCKLAGVAIERLITHPNIDRASIALALESVGYDNAAEVAGDLLTNLLGEKANSTPEEIILRRLRTGPADTTELGELLYRAGVQNSRSVAKGIAWQLNEEGIALFNDKWYLELVEPNVDTRSAKEVIRNILAERPRTIEEVKESLKKENMSSNSDEALWDMIKSGAVLFNDKSFYGHEVNGWTCYKICELAFNELSVCLSQADAETIRERLKRYEGLESVSKGLVTDMIAAYCLGKTGEYPVATDMGAAHCLGTPPKDNKTRFPNTDTKLVINNVEDLSDVYIYKLSLEESLLSEGLDELEGLNKYSCLEALPHNEKFACRDGNMLVYEISNPCSITVDPTPGPGYTEGEIMPVLVKITSTGHYDYLQKVDLSRGKVNEITAKQLKIPGF